MHPRIWRQTFLTDLSHLYCLYVSLCTVCTITGWQWHQWDFEVVVPVHPNISFSVWDRFMSQFLWLHFFLFIWNYSGTYIWFNIHRLLCKTILLTQEAKILTALLLTSPTPQRSQRMMLTSPVVSSEMQVTLAKLSWNAWKFPKKSVISFSLHKANILKIKKFLSKFPKKTYYFLHGSCNELWDSMTYIITGLFIFLPPFCIWFPFYLYYLGHFKC